MTYDTREGVRLMIHDVIIFSIYKRTQHDTQQRLFYVFDAVRNPLCKQ
jgi:hypothetical protein